MKININLYNSNINLKKIKLAVGLYNCILQLSALVLILLHYGVSKLYYLLYKI